MDLDIKDPETLVQKLNAWPYHSPHLLVYGSLGELTAGGTGKANEPQSGSEKPRS